MIQEAVLIGLAAWRLAHLLVEEDGPFDVLEWVRQAVGLHSGEVKGFLPSLFSCVYCMSVWTALLCYLLWELNEVAVIILAAMTIAILPQKLRN